MWLIKSLLLVALATAGWAISPDVVNIPADGKLSEGKYVIYDKNGAEEASVLVTKDMLRTGEENNLRTLHSWLDKYFDKDKTRPVHHHEQGPYNPVYVYGGGNGNGHGHGHGNGQGNTNPGHGHPTVTVVNGITQEHGNNHYVGSTTGGTVIPPGAIVIRPVPTTDRPPTYPGNNVDHHHHVNLPDHYRPNYPDRYPHHYPSRYPGNYPVGHPDRDRFDRDRYDRDRYDRDRFDRDRFDRDRDNDRDRFDRDRDNDRDRFPYDRYPGGRYPYDEHHGYDGQHVHPYAPWAKMRSTAAAARGYFPVYAHQLAAGTV